MRSLLRAAPALLGLLAAGCEYPVPPDPADPELDAQVREAIGRWGVIAIGPQPTPDTALVSLGRALFFDAELSGNRDVACATCHDPARAMGDGASLGVGTGAVASGGVRRPGPGRQYLPRNVPSLLNEGLRSYQIFWDARLSGFGTGPFHLEDSSMVPPAGLNSIVALQAMLPVLSREEMRGRPGDSDVFGRPNELAQISDSQPHAIWAAVMNRLLALPEYQRLFAAAFGQPTGGYQFRHAAQALAAFQTHALTFTASPFDRFLRRENGAMTDEAKRGALLFFGRANCSSCHNGALLGGQVAANVGVPQLGPGTARSAPLDLGRGDLLSFDFYRFVFRAPPLRNVELTAPYFHNGVYPTLEAVVEHYNDATEALLNFDLSNVVPELRGMHHGGGAVTSSQLANLDFRVSQPLNLTAGEKRQLVAFLESLTDPAARDLATVAPAAVPSGLPLRR